ncbi:mevalonate kinase [Sporothrix brasiliensis 5110]|uniref:Mevalonate kinase n=1 Tax=Sporothrix brasiliensis 5110 TaxID=1398154 RepID=A0A0C2FB95_9PEZI|nr:mevalonate kinase [Sporothrix brasiliensis 5110]KIH88348.1 mevalonate kinase [Sporothrix brasiliensis 5110]
MTSGVHGLSRDVDRLRIAMTANDEVAAAAAQADAANLQLQARYRMNRKASSPMMPAFMVSAPGKVIVFGEHAVVHGKAAVAAAISLRSYLLVTTLSKSKRTVTLRFPDIDMSHSWNIDELPWEIFSKPGKKKFYYDLVTSLDSDLLDAIQPHLANVSLSKSEHERKVHQASALSFLYLFLSLGSQKFPGCVYTLRSTIPIGAGLGSSGSIAVCMATALLLQLRTLSGPHPDQPADEARLQIERINRWAFVAEMCIHGNPSGVDNTVSTQGKAVVFQRADYNKPPSVKSLWSFPELPLLLVDTKQAKSTKFEVAKVARLKRQQPVVVGNILNAIDAVSRSAIAAIEGKDADADADTGDSDSDADQNGALAVKSVAQAKDDEDEEEPDQLSKIGQLMAVNHGLLCALNVSHPRLERVRELVDHEGIGWTKLTGAGGGGCSITLIKPGTPKARVLKLEQQLAKEGYQQFVTTLGGDGVGVLWPAILRNGMDEDEEGGMEIDVEKFLNAEGNDGVERLVGVEGGGGEREGWKFWRM